MIELWGGTSQANLSLVQKLQNRAVRSIFEFPYLTPRVDMYGSPDVRFLPVRGVYEASVCTYVFKTFRGMCQSELTFNCASHPNNSRQADLILRPHCSIELCKNRMSFIGPTKYNSLPLNARTARNVPQFRRMCFEHLSNFIPRYF